MYEDYAVKMAKLMTEYSVPIQEGQLVLINGNSNAVPMVQALYEAVLRRGGHPIVWGGTPGLRDIFWDIAEEHQLKYVNPLQMYAFENIDVNFSIMCSSNTKSMSTVPPEKMAMAQQAMTPFRKLFFERMGKGELKWVLFPYPSQADAQEAEMGLRSYTKFLYEAANFHLDDPVAHWKDVQEKQTRITEWLADKSEAVVKGPGIDLSFKFKDRNWVSCHGNVNFPDGEIYTGPIEDSVNGTVEFNMRTVYAGREVNGVRFEYKDGKVVDASAEKNEEFLLSQLDLDEGARRLGEFAIGTNWQIQNVTGNTLFDEKIGGTIHMAVGASIPESGGVNQSNVHWDMVHNMKEGGEIFIDGELFYKEGEFVI